MAKQDIAQKTAPKKQKHQPIASFISDTQVLLRNALNPDILPKMQARGYTLAEIEAKLAEVESLQALHFSRSAATGRRIGAKEAFKAARAALIDAYVEQLQLARLAFKNDVAAQVALELKGRRHEGYAAFALQGITFCSNLLANDGWMAAMAAKGVQQGDVQALLADLEALRTLAHEVGARAGDAIQSTQARNAVYHTLRPWLADFRKVARIALRHDPQMCEALGIKVKS